MKQSVIIELENGSISCVTTTSDDIKVYVLNRDVMQDDRDACKEARKPVETESIDHEEVKDYILEVIEEVTT